MFKEQTATKTPKTYRVISKLSKKQLGVSTDPQTYGVIVLKNPSNYPSNRFNVEYHKTHHLLRSQLTNQYVSVLNESQKRGAVLVTLPYFGAKSQKLFLKHMQKDNQYIITTFCGLVLDCYEEGDQDGSLITQWEQNSKNHQIWIFQPTN